MDCIGVGAKRVTKEIKIKKIRDQFKKRVTKEKKEKKIRDQFKKNTKCSIKFYVSCNCMNVI